MACFIVPATEAVVTTIVTKIVEMKEKDKLTETGTVEVSEKKTGFSRKLKWLNGLLWGGSALLAFEHIWHGEVTPWFPFLTAMSTPESASEMFREMATNGVLMAVLVTAVWGVMVGVSSVLEKRTDRDTAEETA